MRKQCYNCNWRRDLPGDAHSLCVIGMADLVNGSKLVKVVGTPHGIEKGWFMWPFNFDPVWLESCNAHITKEDYARINSVVG
jgi:hypothetical protein